MNNLDFESGLRVYVPDHMHDALKRYVFDKIEPGGFLYAVLTNDLKEAVARADQINKQCLPNYVAFLYNHAPSACWGSPQKVEKWLSV